MLVHDCKHMQAMQEHAAMKMRLIKSSTRAQAMYASSPCCSIVEQQMLAGSHGHPATTPSSSPLSRPTRTSSGSGDHSGAASLPPLPKSAAGTTCSLSNCSWHDMLVIHSPWARSKQLLFCTISMGAHSLRCPWNSMCDYDRADTLSSIRHVDAEGNV